MLTALALSDLGMIDSVVPDVSLTSRTGILSELRRLAVIYWKALRARGLGVSGCSLPQIQIRMEKKYAISGLCNLERNVITISVGNATWGNLIETLVHELCHALEPMGGHDGRFYACLAEAVHVLFGIRVEARCEGDCTYSIDRRILDELYLAFDWSCRFTPSVGDRVDLLIAKLRRSAGARGARLVEEDLALLRTRPNGENVRVRAYKSSTDRLLVWAVTA